MEPEASTSKGVRSLCAVCSRQYALYTCPRCSIQTCCLSCSKTHKVKKACSGERDKVAYVALNEYSWGTMMDDYTFLEDVGRRVGDWGSQISRNGLATSNNADRTANTRTKRDVLKAELDRHEIELDLLPNGMEKRKSNMSYWDTKNHTAVLTIEFEFKSPHLPTESFTILSHKNSLKTSLLQLAQSALLHRQKSKKSTPCPSWVNALLYADPDDPEGFIQPQFTMSAQVAFEPTRKRKGSGMCFYRLNPLQPLSKSLHGTHFVEYPTIQIWEEFNGTAVDVQGNIETLQTDDDDSHKSKRQKLDTKAGKKAIVGLLGDYDSEESGSEVDAKPSQSLLSALGGYVGSDEDQEE